MRHEVCDAPKNQKNRKQTVEAYNLRRSTNISSTHGTNTSAKLQLTLLNTVRSTAQIYSANVCTYNSGK